jgi:formylmethanofuran dehydrogenase subunit E
VRKRISLKTAVDFHGHLGPYLVLGLLAGEMALKKLSCKKYFGLEVRVWGADQKPKSCLIDGLQLATGATYGKGNIQKLKGRVTKIEFCNRLQNRKIIIALCKELTEKLAKTRTHRDAEILARQLYKTDHLSLFYELKAMS